MFWTTKAEGRKDMSGEKEYARHHARVGENNAKVVLLTVLLRGNGFDLTSTLAIVGVKPKVTGSSARPDNIRVHYT